MANITYKYSPERKRSRYREYKGKYLDEEEMRTKFTEKRSHHKPYERNYKRSKREKSEEKIEFEYRKQKRHISLHKERGVKRAYSPTFRTQPQKISKFYKRYNTDKENICVFWKKGSPFSQFFTAHFSIKGQKYTCTEQYMMAMKADFFQDEGNFQNIIQSNNPINMKSFGRQVRGFDADIWNMCCRQIVFDGNRAKFTQNKSLLQTMLETEDRYFAEANPYDRIWGIGVAATADDAYNPRKWRGTNWLGEALNQVKFEIQSIAYTSNNKIDISHISIEKIFSVGLYEKFEKMHCFIKIDRKKSSNSKSKFQNSKFPSKRKSENKHTTLKPELLSKTAKLKIHACRYIAKDWARERILDSPSVLAMFLELKQEEIETIPGYFTYESNHNQIMSCTSVARVLRKLSNELNAVRKLVEMESDSIRRYSCSRACPCKPQKS